MTNADDTRACARALAAEAALERRLAWTSVLSVLLFVAYATLMAEQRVIIALIAGLFGLVATGVCTAGVYRQLGAARRARVSAGDPPKSGSDGLAILLPAVLTLFWVIFFFVGTSLGHKKLYAFLGIG